VAGLFPRVPRGACLREQGLRWKSRRNTTAQNDHRPNPSSAAYLESGLRDELLPSLLLVIQTASKGWSLHLTRGKSRASIRVKTVRSG